MAGPWTLSRGDSFWIDVERVGDPEPFHATMSDATLNGTFATKAEALDVAISGLEVERDCLSKSLARLKRQRRALASREPKP